MTHFSIDYKQSVAFSLLLWHISFLSFFSSQLVQFHPVKLSNTNRTDGVPKWQVLGTVLFFVYISHRPRTGFLLSQPATVCRRQTTVMLLFHTPVMIQLFHHMRYVEYPANQHLQSTLVQVLTRQRGRISISRAPKDLNWLPVKWRSTSKLTL